jgi:hypothetical protein
METGMAVMRFKNREEAAAQLADRLGVSVLKDRYFGLAWRNTCGKKSAPKWKSSARGPFERSGRGTPRRWSWRSAPEDFFAVGQFFDDFAEVTDDMVVAALSRPQGAVVRQPV